MSATVDNWRGPGSGTNVVAPNTFWVISNGTGQVWDMTFQAFNASGGLVTLAGWEATLWDVTAGAAVGWINGPGANTINVADNMNTNGHLYTYAYNITSGSCDHIIASTTGMGSATTAAGIRLLRRSSAWASIPGHQRRIRRGGAWVPINGGHYVRRSGIWQPPS